MPVGSGSQTRYIAFGVPLRPKPRHLSPSTNSMISTAGRERSLGPARDGPVGTQGALAWPPSPDSGTRPRTRRESILRVFLPCYWPKAENARGLGQAPQEPLAEMGPFGHRAGRSFSTPRNRCTEVGWAVLDGSSLSLADFDWGGEHSPPTNDHVCATVEKVKHPASQKFFIPSRTRSCAILGRPARTEFRHDSCNTAGNRGRRSGPRRTLGFMIPAFAGMTCLRFTIYDWKAEGRDMRTSATPKPEFPPLAGPTCHGRRPLQALRVSVVTIRAKQSQKAVAGGQ
jgi:hypothetical protein